MHGNNIKLGPLPALFGTVRVTYCTTLISITLIVAMDTFKGVHIFLGHHSYICPILKSVKNK